MLIDERTQKILFAELLVSNDLEYSETHLIVDAQSIHSGHYAMSPAELLHIRDLDISIGTAMSVADTLEEFFSEPTDEFVTCPVCFESDSGTIEKVGHFLNTHMTFHSFQFNSLPMINFGEGDDKKGDSE
jgi:hypothetical protein